MLKNYLTIAWRNLTRNRVYSFINIFGLALGMAIVLLIGSWIRGELLYNTSFPFYDRLLLVGQNSTHGTQTNTWFSDPAPLSGYLREQYAGDFSRVARHSWAGAHTLATEGGEPLNGKGVFAESQLPDMLSLPMLSGNRSLSDPSSILLSRSLATALFKDRDPLNQSLRMDNKGIVKVTGVYEDLPANTDLKDFNFISTWDYYRATQPWIKSAELDWNSNAFQTLAQLQPGAQLDKVGEKIKGALLGHDRNDHPQVLLHPMSRWHLYDEFKNGRNTGGGHIRYAWLFGFIGVFILLLACINFMNLSTARSERRAKEVGIRKAIGSLRRQLVGQFLGESVLLAFIAAGLALLLASMAMPWFSRLAGKTILLPWSLSFVGALLGFTLFVGLLAGSYPAIYLSSFNAVKVLKGALHAGRSAALPRRVLIVLQFTVSISLIIGTIVVFQQIVYLKNRPIGYSREGLLSVEIRTDDLSKHYDVLREELIRSGAVADVTKASSGVTGGAWQQSGFAWSGKDPNVVPSFDVTFTTEDYGKTVGWELQQGRDLSRDFLTDSAAMVVNEAAVRYMGFKQPVGATVQYLYSERKDQRYRIVGVIKDMVTQSPNDQVRPAIYMIGPGDASTILLKVSPRMSVAEALPTISSLFRKYNPAAPFDFAFSAEEYARKFDSDERVLYLAVFFASFAIFISCLGLFGLAAFMAEQRMREIGVRKVLGATAGQLWGLLSRDFLGLVCIAFLIALPLAWYGMHRWLQGYEYRTGIPAWIFIVVLAGALLITLVTVSFQSIRASLANPVKSLRTE